MLAISSKISEPVEWTLPVLEYCEQAFGGGGAGLGKFLATVDELRLDALSVGTSVEAQRNGLRRYLGALGILEDKFPIGQPISSVTKSSFAAMNFVWGDSFRPRMKSRGHSVRFERAAILFNYAASQSLLARDIDRSSPEGQKNAVALFQNAAGIFLLLRDQFVPDCVAQGDQLGPDLSDAACSMSASLMLAQAQALFYEKAVKDKSSRSLLAKLSNQASTFYATAGTHMAQLSSHLDPSWLAHCKFQEILFLAAAHFQQAMADKPNVVAKLSGFGPLVARLRAARDTASLADTLSLNPAVLSSINGLKEAIKSELTSVEYDNTNVYIELVPNKDALPPIGLVPAVKAAQLTLFDLMDSEYLSGFSGVIDSLAPPEIRQRAEQLEAQTSRICHLYSAAVANLAVPDSGFFGSSANNTQNDGVPEEIWAKIARIQVLGGALGLEGQMASLHGATGECEALVAAISRSLDEEERDDKVCRDRFEATGRFNRVPSSQLTTNFRVQISNYKSKLGLAIETNAKVTNRICAQQKSLVATVSKSRAEIDLVWKNAIVATTDPKTEQLKTECRTKTEAIESLISVWRKKCDDFTQKFGTSASMRIPELLKAAKSGDVYIQDLVSTAESECHTALEEMNGAFAALCAELEEANERLAAIAGGENAGNWQHALKSCASVMAQGFGDVGEGITFFGKLTNHLKKLKEQVDDYCFARNEEKSAILQNIQRTLSDGSPQIPF